MNQLQPGQVYELHDVYVGSKDKLPTRIVVYKCTEEQKQKRLRDRAIREKKKGITIDTITLLLNPLVFIISLPSFGIFLSPHWAHEPPSTKNTTRIDIMIIAIFLYMV